MEEYIEEYIEPTKIERTLPKQQSWYLIITIFVLSILYVYIAIKEYPKWRKLRENFFTKTQKTSKVHSETEEPKNPLLYIPFIPFAAVYLALRIIWDTFRLFVFYSLDLIEAGFITFWQLLLQGIKMIPKICAAIPSLWKTYIQKPFLKVLYLWLDWMYLYAWPVFKFTVIKTWEISVITWTEGKKVITYSWNFIAKYSKIGWDEIIFPSIITFILEPGKWFLSKIIYLGKIAWYCACFLARDLAEDFRELFYFGWKISVIMYDNALQPVGKFIYENIKYHFPRFIFAIKNETIYLVYEIFRDSTFRSCVECIHSIIQSSILYDFVKNIINDISRKLQIIKPKLMNRMRLCGLELVEFSFTTVLEIAESSYTYYKTLLPIIISIPIVYNEFKHICNEFYKNFRERVLNSLKSLWAIFSPLLRPVISALSFFYTTVILNILLSAFKMANWVISVSITAFNEVLVILQKSLSTLYSISEPIYNAISPYIFSMLQTGKDVMYELYVKINDLVTEYFPSFRNYFTGVVSRQIQIFKEYVMIVYKKYEPVILELKDRVRTTADEVVVSIGQGMLEWVKKEKALKEGNLFKEE